MGSQPETQNRRAFSINNIQQNQNHENHTKVKAPLPVWLRMMVYGALKKNQPITYFESCGLKPQTPSRADPLFFLKDEAQQT